MQIHKLSLAVLLIGAGSAHAQFGANPMMNPMTMVAPMGMAGMGGMANPMGATNPLAILAPLGMMAAPIIMPLGANLLSGQGFQPQSMMNPYLNPMAASNPYLNPTAGMINPFMMMQPPASGYGGYGRPAAPAQVPQLPFFPMMPGAAATPVQAYGAPTGPATVNPFMMMQPPASGYAGYGRPAAPAQAPQLPFFPMMPAPDVAPVAAPAPQNVAPAAASTPFDPAMWLRMMGGGMAPAPESQAAPVAAP